MLIYDRVMSSCCAITSMSLAFNVATVAALVVLALRLRERRRQAEPPQPQWPTLSD
jgi:hypothetical protein